jgi:hypothetical protein
MTGPDTLNAVPQELFTGGGVGGVCAFEMQATVLPELDGGMKVGGLIV